MQHRALAFGRRHPSHFALPLTLLVLALIISGCGAAAALENETSETLGAERPNIVFILTDDLSRRLLRSHLEDYPNIEALADSGVRFSRSFVSEPVCCPSRATSLTGLYSHNHGIRQIAGLGGSKFAPQQERALPVWLNAVGYETGYFGKYLNGYPISERPPGWDEWHAEQIGHPDGGPRFSGDRAGYVIGYSMDGLNTQGRTHTQVFAADAADFIRGSAQGDAPFFAYIAPYAPHRPSVHPPRYDELYTGLKAPRTTSFDEQNVSDKPKWIRDKAPLADREKVWLDEIYRDMLRSVQDVDDLVGTITQALRESGELENTYIVFTSDNGFHLGQHRLRTGKWTAYEEDIRVPLIISGPGVPAGDLRRRFVLNTDWAPTFADWADATEIAPATDGRSLTPLLVENPTRAWRTGVLIEGYTGAKGRPSYSALRSRGRLYVEHATGEKELYNLYEDRQEMNNLAGSVSPAVLENLSARLAALKRCSGLSCREAEQVPRVDLHPDSPTTSQE